ncbi:MAG: hypothetical protein HY906_18060, partial [Deltaproteobacteria bacterium]|nr:hypothetical protein [Deltaproteobacteria bacterium]
MDPLCRALLDGGTLDDAGLELVQAHLEAYGGTLDAGLLELDLVDEVDLLAALEQSTGLPAARPTDLRTADPAVAARLPLAAADSFRLCPVRLEADGLVALVPQRLPEDWEQELHDLFGLTVTQLVAPAHYLAVVRAAVYGTLLEARAQELEQRLERRRQTTDAAGVVVTMARAPTAEDAAAALLAHGERFLECCCLMRPEAAGVHLVTHHHGAEPPRSEALPLEPGCVFAAALLHGG